MKSRCIELYRNKYSKSIVRGSIITVGNFDGLHRGHQKLFDKVSEIDKETGLIYSKCVVSFYPHPSSLINKKTLIPWITSTRQELNFLNQKFDIFFLIKFSKNFSKLSADIFIQSYLKSMLNAKYLILGEDSRFGTNREADTDKIKEIAHKYGIITKVCSFEKDNGIKISSSLIRVAITTGDFKTATKYLGRPFSILGKIIHGKKRGQKLGFRTANLKVSGKMIIPPNGVYSAYTFAFGKVFKSILNIGKRPTFENSQEISIEVHLIDNTFDEFYFEYIEIFFIDKIREEIKFESKDNLIKQINSDIIVAKKHLSIDKNEVLIKSWLKIN